MGFKKDQNYYPETYGPTLQLPPRANEDSDISLIEKPPPYVEQVPTYHSQPLTHSWSAQDPRSSSSQSLVPETSLRDGKRKLLLIYIHGFMGNETSFQSFPAHVHNIITIKLGDSHDVHTKVYPRYKTRKAIQSARDDFSKWLRPHESSDTDVILLGHSMGGILSAEVALMGLYSEVGIEATNHRILGTINLDVPFLGMHPGVVASGLGSLFTTSRDTAGAATNSEGSSEVTIPLPDNNGAVSTSKNNSKCEPINSLTAFLPTQSSSSDRSPISPLLSPTNDPNYNPPFPNDVRMATRTGWANALHFVNKHSDSLRKATTSYITSYFEFGGCMADYKGLKMRYSHLRDLENEDRNRIQGQPRVRFINYYTASTGPPKKVKSRPKTRPTEETGYESNNTPSMEYDSTANKKRMQDLKLSDRSSRSRSTSRRNSVENQSNDEPASKISVYHDFPLRADCSSPATESQSMRNTDATLHGTAFAPGPKAGRDKDAFADGSQNFIIKEAEPRMQDDTKSNLSLPQTEPTAETREHGDGGSVAVLSLTDKLSLPPIPPQPEPPAPLDPSLYSEKDARKLAEKEHSRQTKAYQRAIKDRDQAIKDRRKLLGKREKSLKLNRGKQVKQERKALEVAEKQKQKKAPKNVKAPTVESRPEESTEDDIPQAPKPKRDKKFCMLPPRIDGEIDPCWVRVYMRGVDEVGAHCGLFFVGEHYEWLVNDVGERIKSWVHQQWGG